MSAGCIPTKKERHRIVSEGLDNLKKAVKILSKLPDPDKDRRKFEEAVSLVRKAMGTDYPDKYNGIGFDWLLEHYFS